MPLLHPSGGLVYHLRAWRWRRSLWRPFLDTVGSWLDAWRPGCEHLVLIGPSAGYALHADFLRRFPRISVLEPDPLARFLLSRRFPGQRFVHEDSAWLAQAGGFGRLAERHPHAAFLFCNLLGQLPVGADAGFAPRTWLADWEAAMAGRPWASWHDLASTCRPPDRGGSLGLAQAEPLDAILARYWQGGELEIHDHGCAGLKPCLPRRYAVWQIVRGRYHLVEWLHGGN